MKRDLLKNQVLKLIVEEYIADAKPIGSVYLINKHQIQVSSATIRNVMADLEKEGLIQKSHTSSGRIPTFKGYEFYAKYLTNNVDEQMSERIKDIFARRRSSIDGIIDEAVSIISKITKLTVITSESAAQELLKSIALTPISDELSIIVIITSSGRVDTKELRLNQQLKLNDLKIAIRIFQERLHNIPLVEIPQTIKSLEPLLRNKIKHFEQLIESFVSQIFTSYVNMSQNHVFGKSYIIQAQDIERNNLVQIIDLIEKQSIWEAIDEKNYLEENLKLEILPSNASLISKRLNLNGHVKDISIVGPSRMDYSQAKNILNMIEKYALNLNATQAAHEPKLITAEKEKKNA